MSFSCESPDEKTRAFMMHSGLVCRDAVFASTMPFYATQDGQTIQCGSGVLLEIADMHFIITAAHTFDVCQMLKLPVFITSSVVGDLLIPFDQVTLRYPPTSDPYNRTDDPFDICVCELSSHMTEKVKRGKRFLHLNEVEPFDGLDPRSFYMVFGYPTILNPTDELAKKVFSSAVAFNTFIYCCERGEPVRYDREVEILLDFDAKTTTNDDGVKSSPPNPKGISGCRIWRLAEAGCSATSWKPEDARLVGIQHGWDTTRYLLRGTRIRFALQIIYRNYDSLKNTMEFHYGARAKLL